MVGADHHQPGELALRARGAAPPTDPDELAEDAAFSARSKAWARWEAAYTDIQGTKPQSLAYGLNDSPAGLAAWIIEKFRAWGDTDGDVESAFARDDLLTNLSIYWFTQTITASSRLYWEHLHSGWKPEYVAAPPGTQMPTRLSGR